MNFVMDFIVGCLGYLVSMLVYELAKGWWKRPEARPREPQELLQLPPNFDAKFEHLKQQVEQLKPKRPIPNPRKKYSVAEILELAREEQRRKQR